MNYIGEDVNLQFQVLVGEKGEEPTPTSPLLASVNVYDPNGKPLISEQGCTVKGSMVKAKLEGKTLLETIPGKHTAIFHVRLKQYGLKDHVIKFDLSNLPVKKKVREREKKR